MPVALGSETIEIMHRPGKHHNTFSEDVVETYQIHILFVLENKI